jgi:hypothetical protein
VAAWGGSKGWTNHSDGAFAVAIATPMTPSASLQMGLLGRLVLLGPLGQRAAR